MAKNIVVFSDGTGQEGGITADSNVFMLYKMAETRSPRQISFYDRGLGTARDGLLASVSGAGISRNILECYRFIHSKYCDGDRIFLFGFSRGAATVRSLAGFIDLFGMLPDSRPDLVDRAWEIYQVKDETKRLEEAGRFVRANGNLWCDVDFVGVWDTVSALGVPSRAANVILDWLPWTRHKFHDLKLSKRVRHARHALAIDDERRTFHPTLWDEDIGEGQTLKQVWFCGMHTDVGGGYPEHSLSDVPLAWMIREAVQQGLRIYARHEVEFSPDARGVMHDSRSGVARAFRRARRSWGDRKGVPTVHASVLERSSEWRQLEYDPWILRDSSRCETEPAVSDSAEFDIAMQELMACLDKLDAPAIGAEDTSLAALKAKLEVELQVIHANSPRGDPESEYRDAKVARRKRGEARGEFFGQALELVERLEALDRKLKAPGVSWREVVPVKQQAIAAAQALYGTHMALLVKVALSGSGPEEFWEGGRLRGYTYETSGTQEPGD